MNKGTPINTTTETAAYDMRVERKTTTSCRLLFSTITSLFADKLIIINSDSSIPRIIRSKEREQKTVRVRKSK